MSDEIVLAEGKAEQAHAGRTSFSWLAVRGNDGAFVSLPHIAGQTGRLVWIPVDRSADDVRS
jgi:hypothetical protein